MVTSLVIAGGHQAERKLKVIFGVLLSVGTPVLWATVHALDAPSQHLEYFSAQKSYSQSMVHD